ncbi:MAG TPA: RHS repeat-associated core domain-containing protein [Geothrix sp.]
MLGLQWRCHKQARFYAPMCGRFLSPDPARDQHFEETQSWNIYSYVRNNPVMAIDPNGMEHYWVVVNAADPNRMAQVYVTRNDGSLRATYDARAMGVKSAHHRRDVANGDTPYGTARAGRIMIGKAVMQKKYGKEKAKSYGEAKINLVATSGELQSTGRATTGVALHGGGGNLGDHAYDAQQRLDNTQGCVRMHNQDVVAEAKQIQQNADHGETATFHIGTADSLRNEARGLNANVPGVNQTPQSGWLSRIVQKVHNLLQ